jgi:hypothetical protein
METGYLFITANLFKVVLYICLYPSSQMHYEYTLYMEKNYTLFLCLFYSIQILNDSFMF